MIEFIHGIVLGIVQGLCEFLPVSSSGHLILVPKLLHWTDQGLAFDTVLHLGTLVALLWFFRRDLIRLIRDAFGKAGELRQKAWRLIWQIVVASIPALALGYLLSDWLAAYDRSAYVVAFDLAFWALFLFAADRYSTKHGKTQTLEAVSWKQTLIVAITQPLSLLPGTSRSGITITAGMFSGLSREAAARFSFYVSIPVTAAAGAFGLLKIARGGLAAGDRWSILIVGFVSATVAGYVAIRFLLGYVLQHRYDAFVAYRLALSLLVLVVV